MDWECTQGLSRAVIRVAVLTDTCPSLFSSSCNFVPLVSFDGRLLLNCLPLPAVIEFVFHTSRAHPCSYNFTSLPAPDLLKWLSFMFKYFDAPKYGICFFIIFALRTKTFCIGLHSWN